MGTFVCPPAFNIDKMTKKWMGLGMGAAIVVMILVVVTVPVLAMPRKTSDKISQPIATTPYGKFQGSVRSLADGSSVIRYSGIPFAQPPVGKLRFQPPQPLQKKADLTFDASGIKKSCWSITKKMTSPYHDEDCLYLNVYVPTNDNGNYPSNQTYSTMVWMHGGGFVAGSVFPEPSLFVSRGNVIVVTFNYRLGVFGFLTTKNSALPANNGLLDQLAALKWVNENIEYFGGDPSSITIGGESAGAASAALHALSPMSSKLFNRVILQSGAASFWLRRNPVEVAKEFGNNVGCYLDDNTTLFASCLRNVSVEEILLYSKAINMTDAQKQLDFIWVPTIDGKFIIDDPSKLLANTSYLSGIDAFNKDYLIGFNNDDGSIVTNNFLYPSLTEPFYDNTFFTDLLNHLIDTKYGNITPDKSNKLKNVIKSFYIGNSSSEAPVSKKIIVDIVADSVFFAPELNIANSMSINSKPICGKSNSDLKQEQSQNLNASGKTFVYYFDYCLPNEDICRQQCMTHGLQVYFAFPKKNSKIDEIRKVVNNFITILSDFVKTAEPDSSWPEYENEGQYYFPISPYANVRNHPFRYQMNLWLNTIPSTLSCNY